MIFIALGANLPSDYGGPLQTLCAAINRLEVHDDLEVLKRSNIYKSAPVPLSDQPWYPNAIVSIDTDLKPFTLMAVLQEIEIDFGRKRDTANRNAARTLDLDIITYHDLVIEDQNLQIPHPRMHDRAFVLLPLKDVSSNFVHPASGACIDEMIKGLSGNQDCQKIEGCYDSAT
ncbi:MAG: 2-amino-4-hydroxy-6-hydroxymethyldihydropteridine diphosphokinase [Bdellovibrionales bacterium]